MASPTPVPAAAGAAPPAVKRRFIGRNPATPSSAKTARVPLPPLLNQIPAEIQDDPLINASIDALLPKNYNFEVKKTIWQIRKFGIQRVALQMPEGLAMFGTSITDLVEMHTDAEWVFASLRWAA
jgi:2-(3-amino-3-carboxypropyl)histidine synthase